MCISIKNKPHLKLPNFLDKCNCVYEIDMNNEITASKRPLECKIVVCQLPKLKMLELHYDFFDRSTDTIDFKLVQMNTLKLVAQLIKLIILN